MAPRPLSSFRWCDRQLCRVRILGCVHGVYTRPREAEKERQDGQPINPWAYKQKLAQANGIVNAAAKVDGFESLLGSEGA
jgi:hypothetical protein